MTTERKTEKVTKAQLRFLRAHKNGFLGKTLGWTFVDRMHRAGLIEIVPHENGNAFPWFWAGTRLTDHGRKAIATHPAKEG